MTDELSFKPIVWVGSSRKDLCEFPEQVQHHMGYALYVAQQGGKHRDAKTLTSFGEAGVVEIVKDCRSDTFRAVCTLRFQGRYTCFMPSRKSKIGRETPRRDIEMVEQRQREAERIAGEKSYE